MKKWIIRTLGLGLLTVLYLGCGGDKSGGTGVDNGKVTCEPGQKRYCSCGGLIMGEQTCAFTGDAWSICGCGANDAGQDAAADGDGDMDADADGDTDSDADGDTDSDADSDADTDGDGDADGGPDPYQTDTDTMALWHCDDTSGNILADATGTHPGTGSGDLTSVDGRIDKAVSLNGTTDQFTCANFSGYLTTSFTIEAWVKTSAAAAGVIVNRESGTLENDWQFGINASGAPYLTVVISYTDITMTATRTVNDNAFHHVAATYDSTSGNGTIYVDGTESGTASFLPGLSADVAIVTIGDVNSGSQYFNGVLDEIRLSSKVRTPSEFNL